MDMGVHQSWRDPLAPDIDPAGVGRDANGIFATNRRNPVSIKQDDSAFDGFTAGSINDCTSD
ncbi:hypothetical protein GCM10022280_09780 [Sphingomonas swuensis]|uniref:Uncharacterized protein n=1 Tax=Sphingomonas swuensis TaxID=977800 RepID=A0ABP7SM58_9SPHN